MFRRVILCLCFLSSVFGGRVLFGDGLVYALPSITGVQPGPDSSPVVYNGYYQPVYGTYGYVRFPTVTYYSNPPGTE